MPMIRSRIEACILTAAVTIVLTSTWRWFIDRDRSDYTGMILPIGADTVVNAPFQAYVVFQTEDCQSGLEFLGVFNTPGTKMPVTGLLIGSVSDSGFVARSLSRTSTPISVSMAGKNVAHI